MFESAELGHSISKRTYAREVPKVREALLDAQYDLFQDGLYARIKVLKTICERLESALKR